MSLTVTVSTPHPSLHSQLLACFPPFLSPKLSIIPFSSSFFASPSLSRSATPISTPSLPPQSQVLSLPVSQSASQPAPPALSPPSNPQSISSPPPPPQSTTVPLSPPQQQQPAYPAPHSRSPPGSVSIKNTRTRSGSGSLAPSGISSTSAPPLTSPPILDSTDPVNSSVSSPPSTTSPLLSERRVSSGSIGEINSAEKETISLLISSKTNLQNELSVKEREVEGLRVRVGELEDSLKTVKGSLSYSQEDGAKKQETIESLNRTISSLKSDFQNMEVAKKEWERKREVELLEEVEREGKRRDEGWRERERRWDERVGELEAEVGRLRNELRAAEAVKGEFETMKKQKEEVESKLKQVSDDLEILSPLPSQLSTLQSTHDSLLSTHSSLQTSHSSLGEEKRKLEEDVKDLETKLRDAESERKKAEEEGRRKEEEREEERKRREVLAGENGKLLEGLEELRNKTVELTNEKLELTEEVRVLKKEARGLRSEIEEMGKKAEEADKSWKEKEAEWEKLKARLAEDLASSRNEASNISSTLESTKLEISALQSTLSSHSSTIDSLNLDISNHQARHGELEALKKELEVELERLKEAEGQLKEKVDELDNLRKVEKQDMEKKVEEERKRVEEAEKLLAQSKVETEEAIRERGEMEKTVNELREEAKAAVKQDTLSDDDVDRLERWLVGRLDGDEGDGDEANSEKVNQLKKVVGIKIASLRSKDVAEAPNQKPNFDQEYIDSLLTSHNLELSKARTQIRNLETQLFKQEDQTHEFQKRIGLLQDEVDSLVTVLDKERRERKELEARVRAGGGMGLTPQRAVSPMMGASSQGARTPVRALSPQPTMSPSPSRTGSPSVGHLHHQKSPQKSLPHRRSASHLPSLTESLSRSSSSSNLSMSASSTLPKIDESLIPPQQRHRRRESLSALQLRMKEELGLDIDNEGGVKLNFEAPTPPASGGFDGVFDHGVERFQSVRGAGGRSKAKRTKIGEDLIWCASCSGDLFIV